MRQLTDLRDRVIDMVRQLSRDLGNVVVHRSASDSREAQAMGDGTALCVLPS